MISRSKIRLKLLHSIIYLLSRKTILLEKTANTHHMVQSERHKSRKSPLFIEPFWERSTTEPPIRCAKWRIQLKLALLAPGNVILDTLLTTWPRKWNHPPGTANEEPIENSIESSDRERQILNSQLKLQWEFRCQKITEAGIHWGKRP